jgi:membrane associated rhomboid family serine protease
MGESERYIDYKLNKKRFTLGQPDNALVWLFAINVIFYLILQTIRVAISVNDHDDSFFYSQVVNWFQLPAAAGTLGSRPWTLLTAMFTDVELFRALSNMLWLSAFGSVLQNLTGNGKIIPVYLYGGFAGSLFFIAAANLVPSNRGLTDSMGLLGANAAVLAVAVATTMIMPGFRFFRHLGGGIPLWVLTCIYIAIDLASVAAKPAAYPIAHLGGAFAGFVFVQLLNRQIDGSVWMNLVYNWFVNLFNPHRRIQRNDAAGKIFYNTGNRNPYQKMPKLSESRVDEILDKISRYGYHKLTQEEKEILKRASEE